MNWKAFIVVLLLPSLVGAQELPNVPHFQLEPIPPGPDRFTAVQKDEAVPFSGQLFDPATALRWANYLEQYRVGVQLCEKTSEKLRVLDEQYWASVVRAEVDASEEVKTDLRSRLKKVEEENAKLQGKLEKGQPWYNTRGFGIVVGVVGTSALVFGGAVLASSVK
jgi:hypothetical protein